MGKKLDTVWEIDPHTLAKHVILRRYLEAWLPIMTRWTGRVVYIDGFAGPGKYKAGEDGSPIIALKAARDHRVKIKAEVVFMFVEKEKDRLDHLVQTVAEIEPTLPKTFRCYCASGSFNEEMTKIFVHLEEQKQQIAPALVFIDPFGFSHTPFQTVRRIMENRRCEVLITFMYEEINRFLGHPDQAKTYDSLFGTDKWRAVLPIEDADSRRRMIHDIYRDQLEQSACIQFVRSFEMLNNRNHTDYFLFFGTNELLGLEKMKEAMWKVDPTGTYQFSDYTEAKRTISLFADQPDYDSLKSMLLTEFRGKDSSVEEIGDFVVARTPFLRTHIKRQILAPMEKAGELSVVKPTYLRRKGTFPQRTVVRFN